MLDLGMVRWGTGIMSSNQIDETDKPASGGFETAEGSHLSFNDLGKLLFGAGAWGRIYSNVTLRRMTTNFFRNFYSFLAKLPWVAAIIIIAAIVFRGLTEHVTVIQTLSVPETLQKNGYTPEVAGHHLRDALQDFVKSANTSMSSPDIALHGELPDIVVPSVGISLDSVMSTIRSLLRSTRSRNISGEFIIEGDELLLRLRLDNRQIYASQKGAGLNNPDDLLKLAAPEVLKEIKPYFVAVSLISDDASLDDNNKIDGALAMADSIIARLPETDENVAWSYILKGRVYEHRKDYLAAIDALNKAIELDENLGAAHVNLGLVFYDQKLFQKAIDEFRKALKIEPKISIVHFDLGAALQAISKNDEAMAEYSKAININPNYVKAHLNLGVLLKAAGKNGEAMVEYIKVIKIEPHNADAHVSLGFFLTAKGKNDEAIAEYREAIKADPNSAIAHNNLGAVMAATGRNNDAIAEYRAAIRINPNYVLAHNNLGIALVVIGSKGEAIAEFQTVLKIDPNNATAQAQLQQLTQQQ
jgi:tetratricopeptide (TPR) repeat protein